MKKFCTSLREHSTNVINFDKKNNAIVNEKRVKIASGRNRMLHDCMLLSCHVRVSKWIHTL